MGFADMGKKGRLIQGGSVKYTGDVLVVPERYKEIFGELENLALKNPVVRGMIEEFAGVHSGVKPVAILETGDANWSEGDWEDIVRFAEGLELMVLEGDNGQYLLSRDEKMMKELRVLLTLQGYMWSEESGVCSDDRQDLERKIGRMLGFPATATEAFLGNIEPLPDEMHYIKTEEQYNGREVYEFKNHDMRYAGFILSRDHYEEEIETYAKPIRKAMQALFPKIYAEEDFKTILV
ncbi:hypothetical protein FWF89_03065 [Candidatus Saccharibacteria bacterium]|nr:hypothetical protein [Candidatus Saccharibacteria bacterium]